MPHLCNARGLDGRTCFDCQPVDTAGPIVIHASVGRGGFNRSGDTRVIQAGLNDLDPSEGGPDPLLAEDSVVGPLTTAAIHDFQMLHFGRADSRIDPAGPALRKLNELRDGRPVDVSLHAPTAKPRPSPSPPFAPDPQVVTKIVALLPQIKMAIVAADFHLTAMSPFVTHSKLTLPSGPFNEGAKFSIRLVDLFFDLSKLQDPKPSFDRLVTAFRNMKVALNRNFETGIPNLPSLFVPNKLAFMEKQATAYTTAGGAFLNPKQKNTRGVPVSLIVLCNNLLNENRGFQIRTAVHELAHYVSPPTDPTKDPANGDFFNDADQKAMKKLAPLQKVRNAETYAGFAFTAGVRFIGASIPGGL